MTTRIAVALVVILGLAGPILGQTGGGNPGEPRPQPGVALGAPIPPGLPGPSPTLVPDGASFPVSPGDETSDGGGQFWATGDYILGWIGSTHLPPLVTSSLPGTPRASAGVLGARSTVILFGNEEVNGGSRSGGRFDFGYHLDGVPSLGVEAGLFFLEDLTRAEAITSDGSVILARPFIDAVGNNSVATLVGFPGLVRGTILASARSHAFYSGNVDVSERFWCSECVSMEVLAGYRYLHYGDDLAINQQLIPTTAPFPRGSQILTLDQFTGQNDFHGGEIGLRTDVTVDRFSVEVLAKLAAGHVHQEVTGAGSTLTTAPPRPTTTSVGGLLALPSNIGTFQINDWVFAPEVETSFGWQITANLRVRVGYSFLYWSHVARASDQIDLLVNRNQIPPAMPMVSGPFVPVSLQRRGDFWINAINFGAEIRF